MSDTFGVFIQHLIDEHKTIRRLLDDLVNPQNPDFDQTLQLLTFFVEERHHKKEEELLFPALANLDTLREGGPRCTYFFGLYMLDTNIKNVKPSKLRPHIQKLLDMKSPLSVPIEEHIASQYYLNQLKTLKNEDEKLKTLQTYLQIMDLHIQKEDKCLFVMANQKLNPDLQSQLLAQALMI